VQQCQLSVDSFVVWLFIFNRERERENMNNTGISARQEETLYKKVYLKSKAVALKYAAASKCVPE